MSETFSCWLDNPAGWIKKMAGLSQSKKLVKKGILKKRWKEWIKKTMGKGKKAIRKGVSSLGMVYFHQIEDTILMPVFRFYLPPIKQARDCISGSKEHQKFHGQNYFSTWTKTFQQRELHKKGFKYTKLLLLWFSEQHMLEWLLIFRKEKTEMCSS